MGAMPVARRRMGACETTPTTDAIQSGNADTFQHNQVQVVPRAR